MSSNPVFNRIDRDAQKGYAGFGLPQQAGPGAHVGREQMSAQQLQDLYAQPSAGPVQTGRVTMDDVIMKTLGLFSLVVVLAAASWYVTKENQQLGFVAVIGGFVLTLGLGFAIALKKTISVPLIVTYAVVEGVLVGAVSSFYAQLYGNSIVGQAVVATLATFAGMFVAYKTGLIKVTDKFRRIVSMAIFGYMIFAIVNFGYSLIAHQAFGFGGSGPLGIGISLFATGLAAVTLALDFDSIDRAIASGAPEKYSWLLAHGLIVTIVWLYLEMLRLLGRMRS
ncbi:MAG: Bax inhibitor-1/YccA family protein [Nostocoides sp.]